MLIDVWIIVMTAWLSGLTVAVIIMARILHILFNRQAGIEVKTAVEKTKAGKGFLVPGLGHYIVKDKKPTKVCDDEAAYRKEQNDRKNST